MIKNVVVGSFSKNVYFQNDIFLKSNCEITLFSQLYFNYTTMTYRKATRYRKENNSIM